MQGQLVDLRDAYKAIRKALFVKQGQGNEWMQRDRQEGLKLLRQIRKRLRVYTIVDFSFIRTFAPSF